MADYPENYRYSKDHEWLAVTDGIGTVGITDFAQAELGDVVYLDLPEVGKTIKAHDVIGTIESVKAVSDIYSPVSGEVTEVNTSVVDNPEQVNEDPHGEAWLLKVKLSKPDEVAELMDAKAYQAILKSE